MKQRVKATSKHPGRTKGDVWSAPADEAARLINKGWAVDPDAPSPAPKANKPDKGDKQTTTGAAEPVAAQEKE